MNRKQAVTAWIFRLVGLSGMLAIVAVVMPFSWMAATHEYLGLGKMPEGAIVEYLARSLSAIYAVVGVVLWKVSFRFAEQLELVRLLGYVFTVFGVAIWWIGAKAGMPLSWVLLEGPPAILFGLWVVYACRQEGEATPPENAG